MVIIEKNIVYGKIENEYLIADSYRPKMVEGPLPILVLIHGGAFQAGSKEMYKDWGIELAKEGYFVLAINYRLATPSQASYPDVLEDVSQAMNWLVLQANEMNLDLQKIGMIGDSAGAYISTLFALKNHPFSYRLCAVVGVYGLYDLAYECEYPVIERKPNMIERLLGHSFFGNEFSFSQASPITYVQQAAHIPTFDTKFYLVYGKKDKVVNPEQSLRFYDALCAANIDAQITCIEDKGHFWFNELPNIDGGRVEDYPNSKIKWELFSFLESSVKQAIDGFFSARQINVLRELSD